jgi:hypothetical protein
MATFSEVQILLLTSSSAKPLAFYCDNVKSSHHPDFREHIVGKFLRGFFSIFCDVNIEDCTVHEFCYVLELRGNTNWAVKIAQAGIPIFFRFSLLKVHSCWVSYKIPIKFGRSDHKTEQ